MSFEYNSSLLACVEDAADDIIFDHVNYDRPRQVKIMDKAVEVISGADDDGMTGGTFRIKVNGGRFVIDLEAWADLQYDGDYEWCSEEQRSVFEGSYGCENFEYRILGFKELTEGDIDRAIEADVKEDK